MTTKDEALRLALEALREAKSRLIERGGSGWKTDVQKCVNAITAIREALAQPAGELVERLKRDLQYRDDVIQQRNAMLSEYYERETKLRQALQKCGLFKMQPDTVQQVVNIALDAVVPTEPEITACREALAQPAGERGELVAWCLGNPKYADSSNVFMAHQFTPDGEHESEWTALYAPPEQ